jgi:nitroreductase
VTSVDDTSARDRDHPVVPPDAGPALLDALEAVVRVRRTSLRVDRDRPVPDDLVERLLRLANWAPNHKKTFPWRWALVTGEGRERLGAVVEAAQVREGMEPERAARARTKYVRSPLVVLAGAAYQPDPVRRIEDRDAVVAGVENFLLGATAAGLATHWATGDWMADAGVKAFAGLAPEDELIALLYVGWPAGGVPDVPRPEPVVVRVTI